jgi:Protein of unknown function (DUF1018)
MPTPLQIKLIHVAATQAGLSREDYKTILRNCGGVESCKQLDQAGYEDCMATIEDCGFRERDKPGDYWREKVRRRGHSAGSRQVYKIHELALRSRYELAAMCKRFSADRVEEPEQLTPREAWKLIEMLKAANGRENAECRVQNEESKSAPTAPPLCTLHSEFFTPEDDVPF